MSHTSEIPNINKMGPSSPINKKFLTPCRRVGLSRRRKTRKVKRRVSENSPINNSNEVIIIKTTPNNDKKALKRNSNVIDHPQEVSSTTENSLETERKVCVNSFENCIENDLVRKKSKKGHPDDLLVTLETKIHDTDRDTGSLITKNICFTKDNPNTSGINQGNYAEDDFKITNKYDMEKRDSLITKNICFTNKNPNTSGIKLGNDCEENKYDKQKDDSVITKSICTNNNRSTSDLNPGNNSEDDFKLTNKYNKQKQDALVTKNIRTNNNPNKSDINPGNNSEDDFKVTNKYDKQKPKTKKK